MCGNHALCNVQPEHFFPTQRNSTVLRFVRSMVTQISLSFQLTCSNDGHLCETGCKTVDSSPLGCLQVTYGKTNSCINTQD